MTTLTQHKNIIHQANNITNRKTIYAAGAGLIPFPIIDTAALLGVQITMIQAIGKLYGIPFKKNLAKSLVASLIGSGGTVGIIKLIPGFGTMLGGTTAAVAGAGATYALGRVFTQHFDQGGNLLNFDPVSARAYFYKEFEEGKLFVEKQSIEIEGRTVTSDASEKSEKELLLEETEALEKSLLKLQQDINKLQNSAKVKKRSSITPSKKTTKTKAVNGKVKKKPTSKTKVKIAKVLKLTIIEGVGPKIAELLKNGGINSIESLSNTKEDRLREILKEAGSKFNFADPSTWVQQASLAAAGKMEELAVLQKELIGGKIKGKK